MVEDPPAKIEHFSSMTLPTASPVSGKETNCTHSALAAANALTKAPKLVVRQQQSDVILLLIRPSQGDPDESWSKRQVATYGGDYGSVRAVGLNVGDLP